MARTAGQNAGGLARLAGDSRSFGHRSPGGGILKTSRHDDGLEVVKIVGRMGTPAATDSLLRHALLSKWEDVRLAACEEELSGHDRPWPTVPRLISSLTTPAETRFEVARDQDEVRFREVVERQDTGTKQEHVRETRVPLYIPNPNLTSIVNAAAINACEQAQETAAGG